MYAKSPRGLRAKWGPDGAPIRDPLRRLCAVDAGPPELRH